MLKELDINIRTIDVLEQMSGYEKFIKNLFIKKYRMTFELDDNMYHYSVTASQSLVDKKKGPDMSWFHCTFDA